MSVTRWFVGLFVLFSAVALRAQDPADVPPAPPKQADRESADAPAADKPADTKPESDKTEPPSSEQLQEWVKELVHQKFATRQAASQKLIQAGVPGMQAAAEAAKTDDLELATRCLSVLTEGLASKSEAVKKAARTSLEELAKSENKSVAQRARQGLEAPVALPQVGIGRPGFAVQQVRVQVRNGVRELTVIENGKESTISDNNGKDITVTITETVNGQKKTQTYKAKDEEELKKNHPEAHAIYSKYSGGKIGRVQIGGNVFGGNIFGPIPQQQQIRRRPRILNPFKAAELLDEIDKLREKLEGLNERLSKSASADKPDPDELKKISEELKSTTKRLGEIKVESQVP